MFSAISFDPALPRIVGLSLWVSASATLLAAAVGLPLSLVLATYRVPGRSALVLLANP